MMQTSRVVQGFKVLLVGLVLALGSIAGAWAQNSFTVPTLQFKQGDAGTVGNVATLASSSSTTLQFDIGPNWAQYTRVSCTVYAGTSTSATMIQNHGDTFGVANYRVPSVYNATSTHVAWNPATANAGHNTGYIMGRYVVLSISNLDAANAFTGGKWYCSVIK